MTEEQRAGNRARKQKQRRSSSTVEKMAEQIQHLADLPEPPDRETLLKLLGVQAAHGHVTAIRTLLEEYRRDGDSDESKPIFDELAQRRAA